MDWNQTCVVKIAEMNYKIKKMKKMTNEEMLIKIREDWPAQVIHEVFSFKENEYGFYDVEVDKESQFFDTTVLHTRVKLPYPYAEYEKLSEKEKLDWRWS
jgi:hypothetical protein